MAQFTRTTVIQAMYQAGVIPVFYHKDIAICKKIVSACYEGGLRVFEFTNRGDFAHEVFAELNKFMLASYPDAILGVGSVIDNGTTALYLQLGANFIVSPILSEEMAKICNRRKVLWSPGCGTATEVVQALEWGAEIVKIFPGSAVGGPGFVKAIKGPFPWVSIMPTGGVSPTKENLKAWFDAGVSLVGMGSKMIRKDLIAKNDFAAITKIAKETIALIKDLKQS